MVKNRLRRVQYGPMVLVSKVFLTRVPGKGSR